MTISTNPTADLIHARLSLEKAVQNGQYDAAKKAASGLPATEQIKKMGEIADTFNKQNGTNLPIAPKTFKGKAAFYADKLATFFKANKKAFGIVTAVIAGVTAIGLIAKKSIENKKQTQQTTQEQ